YWNYAQHLDFSYLDHPPMVAWLIWLSTSLFGNSEFSVRLPASIAWISTGCRGRRRSGEIF
ncbi:MAG: glycosyltransferase family 39 protein, partial [Candidatus Binatia bacterium]